MGQDNWIDIASISDKPWFSIYLYSFYFIFVTMVTVGYGDFSAKTQLEMIICIFTMLFTCGVFAYALNSINSILANFD